MAGLRPPTPDLAAKVHRSGLFEREGWAIVDVSSYGGHLMPGYSLLFAPFAAVLGVRVVGALAAVASGVLFERIARRHFGGRARLAYCTLLLAFPEDRAEAARCASRCRSRACTGRPRTSRGGSRSRGSETRLDVKDDALVRARDARRLTPARYRDGLRREGVRYVVLDPTSRAEAARARGAGVAGTGAIRPAGASPADAAVSPAPLTAGPPLRAEHAGTIAVRAAFDRAGSSRATHAVRARGRGPGAEL